MSRAWLGGGLAAAVAIATTGIAACDGSDDATSPGTADDAGAETDAPGLDADAPDDDAGGDANDADADASERCSADGFCHTVLPPNQTLRGAWGDDQGTLWAVSEQGDILRWDGERWQIRHSNAGALFAIWGSGPTDIWVGGDRGLLHGQGPSSDALVWTPAPIPALDGVPVRSIAGRSSDDVWAVAGLVDPMFFPPVVEGRVLHFSGASSDPDGGWAIAVDPPERTALSSVWTSTRGDVWLGGASVDAVQQGRGVLLHRGAGGTSFADVPLPKIPRLGQMEDVEGITGGATLDGDLIVLAVSVYWGSYLRGSHDPDGGDGLAWEERTFDVHPSHLHRAAWGPSSADLWLVGDYGRLRHWDGTAWSLPRIAVGKAPVTSTFYAMWARAADDLWFVGDRIALHKRPLQK